MHTPLAVAAFLLVGGAIAWHSRHDLSDSRRHGFYRCFGFETLLLIVYRALPAWFDKPFSLVQIASWILLIVSLSLAIVGFRALIVRGKPVSDFEATTVLVRSGVYRFIRHPLYASLIYLTWGTALKDLTLVTVIASLVATVLFDATARTEERENASKFGEAYIAYSSATKRFVPFLY